MYKISHLGHRGIGAFELNVDGLPDEPEQFEAYMASLEPTQLERLEEALKREFDSTYGADEGASLDPVGVAKLQKLTSQIKRVRDEVASRKNDAAAQAASDAAEVQKTALAQLRDSVHGTFSAAPDPEDDDSDDSDDSDDDGGDTGDKAPEEVTAAALVKAVKGIVNKMVPVESLIRSFDLNAHVRNVSLGDVSRHAPNPKLAPARREPVIVASAGVVGGRDGRIDSFEKLVEAMAARARMLPVTKGDPNYVQVASLQRDFRYRLSLDSTPDEVDEVITAATDVSALVAAGGWCAPSEISYDFYNVVCEDGLVDLPSVGVLNRGGFRFPVSPTIADVFANTGLLWSWTEAQDIAAVTGTGGGVKTCARVECPTFNEVRAACDGLCVTAGNLIDFAYPELIANYLRIVMAARAHRTNQLVIDQLIALAEVVNGGAALFADNGAASSLLGALDLQAFDYRERFRMCEDAVLETILPRWAIGPIRQDIGNRNGLAMMDVTMGQVADWLNIRNIRAQFVADWQSGFVGSPIGDPATFATAWPADVDFLLYAPGTFVRGQGLQLDLGVVRDSTLNTTNDHTAAWMEDCYAIAQVGHEARLVTASTCEAGITGVAEILCA